MTNATTHVATDAWLRQERARLRPGLMLSAFREPPIRRNTAALDALLAIADEIDANVECGSFALCFAHTREDMSTLPDALRAVAQALASAP